MPVLMEPLHNPSVQVMSQYPNTVPHLPVIISYSAQQMSDSSSICHITCSVLLTLRHSQDKLPSSTASSMRPRLNTLAMTAPKFWSCLYATIKQGAASGTQLHAVGTPHVLECLRR